MEIGASNFHKLSYDVISTMTGFLNLQDINSLASTCKEFHSLFSVRMESQQSNQLISSQANADILYLSSSIQRQREHQGNTFTLGCLRFNMTTKDQGWVKDCESGSWVEAEFLEKTQGILPRTPSDDCGTKKRTPLVSNYEVRDFQRKSKILDQSCFPLESNQVNIHLRSSGDGWQISCKQGEIQKFYSCLTKLHPKQLQFLSQNLKKKVSRRTIIRR